MKKKNQIDFITLQNKYETLIKENQALKSENKKLKIQLGLVEQKKEKLETTFHNAGQITSIDKNSSSTIKIKLFTSFFNELKTTIRKRFE